METNVTIVQFLIRCCTFSILPFLCAGVIQKTRSRIQGKKGAPVLQPFWDCIRMIRKDPVDGSFSGFFTESSSMVSFVFSAVMWSLVDFQWASLFFIPFFLAFIRFFTIGFALENGTSFGGMGSSKEILLYVLGEPMLILVLVVFESNVVFHSTLESLAFGFIFLSGSFLVILAELSKPPFDDPRTHLELTMVHESMLLEASGYRMALFELAKLLKTASLLLLLSNLGFRHLEFWTQWRVNTLIGEFLPILFVLVMSFLLGFWEGVSSRRKWSWIPEILGFNFIVMLVIGILLKLG